MSLRKRVPPSIQRAGRKLAVEVGRQTSAYRLLPDFVLIGAQRSGTTSLFRALMQHPQVLRPNFHKGVNYFDINYHRGSDWYAGHFPTAAWARRRVPGGNRPVVFEASGYYMFHPFALPRMAESLPGARLVALLRDPVERAYSAWKHESARGFEHLSFEEALAQEDDRVAGEVERMANDPTYESFSHRHHAYRSRGDYLSQLSRAAALFPRDHILVLYSEDFFGAPEREYSRLVDFLGLAPHPDVNVERYNARPSGSMPEGARRLLTEHFRAQRPELEAFVGREAPWPG